MKKLVVLAVILGLLTLGGGMALGKERVWTVATDATFAPFESVDPVTEEYVGFDIDLIKALGAEAGVTVEIVNVAWDGLIPGLLNGNYDMIIAAMTITPERAMAVDFSDPYFRASQLILVANDNDSIHGPEDLVGKYVTVQMGTTGDLYVSDSDVGRVGRFNTAPEALLEVMNGVADACVVDEAVAKAYVDNNPGQVKIVGVPFTDEAYGIALKKGQTQLLKEVNSALAAVKAKGIYDEIYSKYFAD